MSKSETIFLDQQWQEVNPQRDVSTQNDGTTNFTSGTILFNFNVSGLNSISMKDSYFLITSTLENADGSEHKIADKTTYSHNWASALFSNVSVRVSGQEVSVCNQYNHIAHTLKLRQLVDENVLSSNFRDAMDYDIDFTRRLNKHCKKTGDNAGQYPQREDSLYEQANATGELIRVGGRKRITIYQPVNLGVFDLKHGELCGDISIILNPNPNYETACVESARFAGNDFAPVRPGTEYTFRINKIVFMACYAKAVKPIDSVKTFSLHEYAVQNKPYSEQLEFQVLPSTEQITVLIQDPAAGSNTTIPATSFKVRQFLNSQVQNWARFYGKAYTQDENGQIQVTLGSNTKPPTMMTPYTNMPGEPFQVMRWLMSHQYLDEHKSLYERYNDWCASPYFCFDFMRDSSDTSGFVTVRSNYKTDGYPNMAPGTSWACPGTPILFCVSKYSRVVQITYNSGYVTDIKIQNA